MLLPSGSCCEGWRAPRAAEDAGGAFDALLERGGADRRLASALMEVEGLMFSALIVVRCFGAVCKGFAICADDAVRMRDDEDGGVGSKLLMLERCGGTHKSKGRGEVIYFKHSGSVEKRCFNKRGVAMSSGKSTFIAVMMGTLTHLTRFFKKIG